MAISPRLEIKQAQGLTLTPQLMQSIRLLQLSHLELNSFVAEELERNPLLEALEVESDGAGAAERENTSPEEPNDVGSAVENMDLVTQSESLSAATEIASTLDTEVDNVYPEQVAQDSLSQSMPAQEQSSSALPAQNIGGGEAPDFDRFASPDMNLHDQMRTQIQSQISHPGDLLISQCLIDQLDEAGYLSVSLEQIAMQLGCELADVEAVLEVAQRMEPAGVFARDLAECLALQLAEKDRLDPMMQRLIGHLDLLGQHKLSELRRAVGCSEEDLVDMISEIRALDPRPGLKFDGALSQTVVPDIYVREGPDGGWQVELNAEILPRVLVNRSYYANISRKIRDKQEKEFLVDCLQTANWLTKSLDQRAQTMLKVASEIIVQQDRFFTDGVAHLRPMTLKMIADKIDMHESTISRVTTQKYLSTPRGLFEMKYFFTTALGSATGGDEHSSESVRHFIRQIVDAEDPKKILSDDAIAKAVQDEHGIDVARRTVTKYREAMDIPSSVIRRRQKRQLLAS